VKRLFNSISLRSAKPRGKNSNYWSIESIEKRARIEAAIFMLENGMQKRGAELLEGENEK